MELTEICQCLKLSHHERFFFLFSLAATGLHYDSQSFKTQKKIKEKIKAFFSIRGVKQSLLFFQLLLHSLFPRGCWVFLLSVNNVNCNQS